MYPLLLTLLLALAAPGCLAQDCSAPQLDSLGEEVTHCVLRSPIDKNSLVLCVPVFLCPCVSVSLHFCDYVSESLVPCVPVSLCPCSHVSLCPSLLMTPGTKTRWRTLWPPSLRKSTYRCLRTIIFIFLVFF